MDTMQAILTRRSVRKYTDQPVTPELVETFLRAAMHAPSAINQQPWQFVVLDDPALLARIPDVNPYASMAAHAPLGILICGDLSLEKSPDYWVQDCAAATQNLLLAVHAHGLGAVWTGIYPRTERVASYRALLDLPEHIIPFAFIVIGYPAQEPAPQDRYRAERVHQNKW